jgi:hypothetical protein
LDDTRNGAAVAHHGRSTSLDNHRLSKTPAIAAGRHTYGAGVATAPGLEPGPTSFGGSDAPLHHAAGHAIASQFQQTQPPCDLTRAIPRVRPKTKKAFQGIAPEGLFLDGCRPFRALRLPCRSRCRACRHDARPTAVSWMSTRVRPPTTQWPNRMAAPSMSTANWRIESSIQPRNTIYEDTRELSMGKCECCHCRKLAQWPSPRPRCPSRVGSAWKKTRWILPSATASRTAANGRLSR